MEFTLTTVHLIVKTTTSTDYLLAYDYFTGQGESRGQADHVKK
jgi:hypothetical protein